MGKQSSGLFENWLKHFAVTVFMQSFHAMFLVFILQMLSAIAGSTVETNVLQSTKGGVLAVMAMVSAMALIKFEKLVKQLFGLSDSFMGDFKGSTLKTLAGLGAAKEIGGTIAQPFKDASSSKRRLDQLGDKLKLTPEQRGKFLVGKSGSAAAGAGGKAAMSPQLQEFYDKAKSAKAAGNMEEYHKNMNIAAGVLKSEKTGSGGGSYAYTSGGPAGEAAEGTDAASEIRRDREIRARDAKQAKTQGYVDEYNKELAKYKKNKVERWLNLAGSVASLSMGAGMTDDISQTLQASNLINHPVDKVVTGFSRRQANNEAYAATGNMDFKEEEMSLKRGLKTATDAWVKSVNNDLKTAAVIPLVKQAHKQIRTKGNKPETITIDIDNV